MDKQFSKGVLMAALICGSVCVGGTNVFAEEMQEFTLDPMVVTATRMESKDLDVAGVVDVYDAEKIEKSGANNAYDVLQNTLGVMSQSQGFNGTAMGTMTSKIMIRGVEKGTLVLVNGIAMNQDGKYNLEDIPVDAIERIEVVKGGGSVLYGSEATGGVINIITKQTMKNSIKVQAGNFGKERYSVNVGADKFSMSASLENRGKAEKMSGLSSGKRAGTTYYDYLKGERRSILWNYKLNDALTFTHSYTENEHKYGQHETKTEYNRRISQINDYENTDNSFLLNYDKDGWKAKMAYGIQERSYDKATYKPNGSLDKDELNSWRKGHNTNIDVQKSFDIGKDKLLVGVEFQREDMDLYSAATKKSKMSAAKPPLDSTLERNVVSVYTSYNKELSPSSNLIVNLRETWANGIEGEQTNLKTNKTQNIKNDNMSKFTPELQFVHKLSEDSSFYAKAGKSFRLPNLTQIFGTGVINPKLNLKPEQGTHYEIGYKLNEGNRAWRLAVFNYEIKDSIEADSKYANGSLVSVDYTNQDVRNTGIELSLNVAHDDNWSSRWGIMYNNPQTRAFDVYGNNDWHDYYNKLQLTGGVTYTKGKLMTSLDANYVGKRTGNEATSRKIKPQLFTDLHLSYTPEENHKVFFHLNNILDRQDITSNGTTNYYSLGRNFILGYEYSF